MINELEFKDKFDADIVRAPLHLFNTLGLGTLWAWELWRDNKMIDRWIERNIFTDEGITQNLDSAYSGGTQITSWYCLIFEDNHSPATSDTYAIPGFTESTAYDEANRPGWQEAGVTSKTLTNSANKASFTMNATKTIYGGALVGGGTDPSVKGDAAGGGTLVAESQWSSGSKAVVDDDVLKLTITLTGQDI